MISELITRLERGWQMCDQERDPPRRRRLEDHWLALLSQYERLCDQLASAYVSQSLEMSG